MNTFIVGGPENGILHFFSATDEGKKSIPAENISICKMESVKNIDLEKVIVKGASLSSAMATISRMDHSVCRFCLGLLMKDKTS